MNIALNPDKKPLPAPSELTRPFWDAAKRGELLVQHCRSCGHFQHPPRPQCEACWSTELEWHRCSGKGTVYSCTVAHRPTTSGFSKEAPYSVAIVELDEGPRLTSNVVGCPPAEVQIGQRVQALFDPMSPEVTLVKFHPEGMAPEAAKAALPKSQPADGGPERQYFRTETVDQRILVITIDRPEARNAFNSAMARQLEAIVDRYDADDELWVAIIKGEGGTFCAGQDLKAAAAGDFAMAGKRGPFGIMGTPPQKPLIAAIEGHALAGGFELALSCDLIVATRETRFGLAEVKRGLYAAGGGAFRLPRRLPYHLAMEMVLTGEPRGAAEMQAHGLLNRMAEPGQSCAAALELARVIAGNAPIGVRNSKEVIYRSVAEGWSDEAGWRNQGPLTERVLRSADMREGLMAFAQKRPPVWRNR
jgi:enoyl-CoA hydratase